MNITASDRRRLIRLASTLPKGSEERRAILAGFRQAEEKWIQDAVKRPGALSKRLGIPEDEDIPVSKIKSELAKLKKKSEKGDLTADEKLFQKQLNFALTMKTKVDKKATDRPQGGSMSITASDRRRLIRLASTLPKGSEERRTILAGLRDPTPSRILDQLGYDPFDSSVQEKAEELSGSMDYAGRLWTNYSKKPMGERMWAIRYGLDLVKSSLSSYAIEIHREGGDWSKWLAATKAMEAADAKLQDLESHARKLDRI